MTDGTYIIARYACDICGVNMPEIADQAGQGYFGWSADFVKEEARRHMRSAKHIENQEAEDSKQ